MRRTKGGVILGDNHVAILPNSRATYALVAETSLENPRDRVINPTSTVTIYTDENSWGDYMQFGQYKISPNGPDNLFPYHFKRLIDTNDKLNSMLRTKIDLMMAGGYYLYEDVKQQRTILKDEILDPEIEDWLNSWDFYNYLLEQITDFIYIENNASLMVCNKARRFSSLKDQARIAKIQYLPAEDIRMEHRDPLFNPATKHYFRANWLTPTDILRYPAYDPAQPFRFNASVYFVKMPTFGSKYYGRPPFIGIVSYLELKALILNWQKDNLRNTQFKWHVESSFDYWEAVAREKGWDINGQEIKKYEEELLDQIDAFLRSETAENAQKRFHSKFGLSQFGREEKVSGWKITALEDNTLKNSEAYLKAGEQIDQSIIASVHLDPSLSNIQIQGKLSSGLDKLIAFNIHQITATPIPRRLILSPVNEAIRVNFWKEGYRPKLGFKELQLSYQEKGAGKVEDTQTKEDNK
jgi:hypothetical protein